MKTLQEGLEELSYETRSYSGRGMFGRECLATVVDSFADVFKLGIQLGFLLQNTDIDVPCYDNMGRATIVYWPNIKYESPPVSEDTMDYDWE